jgi:hypothetical protein
VDAARAVLALAEPVAFTHRILDDLRATVTLVAGIKGRHPMLLAHAEDAAGEPDAAEVL